MVCDTISNAEMYYGFHSKFEAAFAFIRKAIAGNYEKGRYEIEGEELYAVVQQYETRPKESTVFEGHKRYIDIQCVVKGRELIGLLGISGATAKSEYDEGKDAALYERSGDASYFVAAPGDFFVFYPRDLHSPGVSYRELTSEIKKIVVKVRI